MRVPGWSVGATAPAFTGACSGGSRTTPRQARRCTSWRSTPFARRTPRRSGSGGSPRAVRLASGSPTRALPRICATPSRPHLRSRSRPRSSTTYASTWHRCSTTSASTAKRWRSTTSCSSASTTRPGARACACTDRGVCSARATTPMRSTPVDVDWRCSTSTFRHGAGVS